MENNVTRYIAPEELLANKIILITGAGDGIGKTAALTYAKYGATIILVGRTLNKLEAVYDEIEASGYPTPAIFPLNLESAQEADYSALHDAISEEFGRLDGILHNAAELGPRTLLQQYASEQWHKVMQVNATAPFMLSKALIPLFNTSSRGSIIFTSSDVGQKGKAYWGAYAASKAAANNIMQVLADEYDETNTLRANSINPGAVSTGMRAAAFPAEDPSTIKSAESIMPAYLYLMGKDSIDVNGEIVNAQ